MIDKVDYDKETFLNGYLAVSVLAGDKVTKDSRNDGKLHHSYETIVRILPLEEVIELKVKAATAANAAATAAAITASGNNGATSPPASTPVVMPAQSREVDIDANQYMKFTSIPPISVNFPFDKYRTLKQSLEDSGIFTYDDNVRVIKAYEDQVAKSRALAAGNNNNNFAGGPGSGLPMGGMSDAIVLKCDFPPTHARSSLGWGLTESQLRERQALLNRWMGELLKSFHRFSPSAQAQIVNFLGLTFGSTGYGSGVDTGRMQSEDLLALDLQEQENASKVFLLMLRRRFIPPKRQIVTPQQKPSKKGSAAASNAAPASANSTAAAPASSMGIGSFLAMAFSSVSSSSTPSSPMKDNSNDPAKANSAGAPVSPPVTLPIATTSQPAPVENKATASSEKKENVASNPAPVPTSSTKKETMPPTATAATVPTGPVYVTKEVEILTDRVNEAVIITSLPDVAADQKKTPQERATTNDRASDVSMVGSTNPSMSATTPRLSTNTLTTMNQETVIYSFLGVKVIKGELLSKEKEGHGSAGASGGKKTHQGYETTIRILPYDDILYPEKEKEMLDSAAYEKWWDQLIVQGQTKSAQITVNKVFDGYRSLKQSLEKEKIYCHDYVPQGTKIDIESVVLDVDFPPTLKQSSWGIALSAAQIDQRTAQLNRWIAALLSKFHLYKPTAQEMICDFLTVEKDDPTQPHGKFIHAMLHRKFVPPVKVLQEPPKPPPATPQISLFNSLQQQGSKSQINARNPSIATDYFFSNPLAGRKKETSINSNTSAGANTNIAAAATDPNATPSDVPTTQEALTMLSAALADPKLMQALNEAIQEAKQEEGLTGIEEGLKGGLGGNSPEIQQMMLQVRLLQLLDSAMKMLKSPYVIGMLVCIAFAFFALGITFLVYVIMALAQISPSEQKELCGHSSAWAYVLVHLLLSPLVFQNGRPQQQQQQLRQKYASSGNGAPVPGPSQRENTMKACWQVMKVAIHLMLTIWGICELWGVSCVNHFDDKLLYVILQIYVIVDVILTGCGCCVLVTACGFLCCGTMSCCIQNVSQCLSCLLLDRPGGYQATPTAEIPPTNAGNAPVMQV